MEPMAVGDTKTPMAAVRTIAVLEKAGISIPMMIMTIIKMLMIAQMIPIQEICQML